MASWLCFNELFSKYTRKGCLQSHDVYCCSGKAGLHRGRDGKGALNKPADDQQSMQGDSCCRLGNLQKKG